MNLAAWLTRAGKARGDCPALALGERVVHDYRGMARRVSVLAGTMRDRLGLRPGDRVALTMKNCPEYVELLFAAWHAGLAAVPVNAKLHASEFAYILENSGTRVVFATSDLAPVIGSLSVDGVERIIEVGAAEYDALFQGESADLAQVAPDDVAWLFYTSGTTGRPKGAMLSHRVLTAMTLNYFADVETVDATDCILHAAPMSHGSGLYILPHVVRAACNLVPESAGFEPDEIFGLMPAWPGMTLFAAPTMVKRMIDFPEDRESANLKTIVYGGGPMYVADAQTALERFGPKMVQIYGQGESPMTITYLGREEHAARDHPRWMERLGSVGVAQSVVEVRVADENDATLPPGEAGEVLVRGDSVMPGYWRNPEATAATLANGWLHTGDVGAMDEDGFLTLKDRSKDVIISGGSNIYPREVEEVLLRHPDVAEVSVIGRPDEEWGETVVAYVVPRGDAPSPDDLDAFCLDAITRFKRPRDYRYLDALPKNNYGKVLKTVLRDIDGE